MTKIILYYCCDSMFVKYYRKIHKGLTVLEAEEAPYEQLVRVNVSPWGEKPVFKLQQKIYRTKRGYRKPCRQCGSDRSLLRISITLDKRS